MVYDISQYWVWLLVAFVIGAIVGWLTFVRGTGAWLSGWFKWGVGAFVVGLVIALFKWIPGRFGFYLETALLLFGSYVIGGHVGAWLNSLMHPAPAAKPVATTAQTAKVSPASAAGAAAGVAAASTVAAKSTAMPAKVADATPTPISAAASSSAAPAATASELPGRQPASLPAPLAAGADNLKLIKGIGPKNESVLNGLGYHHFSQLAAWNGEEQQWIGHKMAFPGRIEREHWVPQAKLLAAGVQTEHSLAVTSGKISASDAPLSDTDAAAMAAHLAATPVAQATPAATGASGAALPGKAPPALAAPLASGADDLKLIKGIGPKNESILNGLGYHHFSQLAAWNGEEQEWVGHKMAFPGRVEREHWVPQAKLLAAGVETDHARDVKSGKIAMNSDADAPLSAEAGAAIASDIPQLAAPLPDEHKHEGLRPLGLAAPRGGKADDLQRIRGIGPQNEERLHKLGIWHYNQIASWTHEQVKWVGSYLSFPGRIDREEWCSQAQILETGRSTDFAKRVDAGKVPTSK
ncbi:MAG: cell envelope biogenesis protein TolA [Hyphomicrobiales bacterium]|nr:cell envelope biogenesis protein TolA [Hyphomicrobiales bacterium]MDE2114044.1 cell envelope biogenesis protein TolA [Hyphomicrobiales bacterium]